MSARYTLLEPAPGIKLIGFPKAKDSYKNKEFKFLNKQKAFTNEIDWNFREFGKLWCYKLNYLECLIQENIDKEVAYSILSEYINAEDQIVDGHEPYPTSLRLIHAIKFLSEKNIKDIKIDEWIGKQAVLLQQNLEYHLMGNHLLENGFSLLFAAFHLRDISLYQSAKEILLKELDEQILEDGAHFELSPMYHLIIFSRVVDAINLISSNDSFDDALFNTLKDKAVLMLSWIDNMMINGILPKVNDCYDISRKDIHDTIHYANDLGIFRQNIPLGKSGYRMFSKPEYTCLFDIGNVGPDYIPGHAHADTLQFLLWVRDKEVISDTGVSTYERNQIRQSERSTQAHNTVVVNDINSSEVWAAFRVGSRAKIFDVKETNESIEASHDGYLHLDVIHKRKIVCGDREILITDTIDSKRQTTLKAYLHFHPDIYPILKEDKIWTEDCVFSFQGINQIEFSSYQYARNYNKTDSSLKAIISFEQTMTTKISIL